MHICFISQEYPPETGWGGIGSYTHEIAHAMVELGHHVTVICRAPQKETTTDDLGVSVHRVLPSPDWDGMRVLWRMNRVWPGFAWAAMRKLQIIHRSDPIDIAEASENRADGVFVPFLSSRPRMVTRLHLAWIFVDRNNNKAPDLKKRLVYWLEKQSILRCDAVTAPSAAVVALTQTWIPKKWNAQVIPNPIDIRKFSPNYGPRKPEVLFVGRLEGGKGIATMAKAVPIVLSLCPEVTVRFVGADGKDKSGRSWRLGILDAVPLASHWRVLFEQIPRSELVERYRTAALCVVPSLWENFPYVVLEAMACGTPVVATQTGGIPELVHHERTGLLTPREDPEALAKAICGLMRDPQRLRDMGIEGRKRAEEFSSAVIAGRMVEAYRTLSGV